MVLNFEYEANYSQPNVLLKHGGITSWCRNRPRRCSDLQLQLSRQKNGRKKDGSKIVEANRISFQSVYFVKPFDTIYYIIKSDQQFFLQCPTVTPQHMTVIMTFCGHDIKTIP